MNFCGSSTVGSAPPCQGGGRQFESGLPLHVQIMTIYETCWQDL